MNTVEERVITEALILMVPFKDLGMDHATSKKCAFICCEQILDILPSFDSNTIDFYSMVKEKLKS